ncbi:MAG: DUF4340 domain-containing protein [Candidatus Brocadiia bacterium]
MNKKTTVIMLILAVILGAYLYFFERKLPTTDEFTRMEKKILTINPKDVSKIEINKDGSKEPIICIKKEVDYWQMSQPVSTRADHTIIDDITKDIPELEKKAVITSTNYAEYGLDKPRMMATFTIKDKRCQFNIGKEAPMDLGTYIQLVLLDEPSGKKQSDIMLIAKSFYEKLNKSLFDFRYKKIFDADAYQIDRIQFKYADGGEIEIAKSGDSWNLVKPVADRCDKTKVQDIINAINDIRISSFEEDNVTDFPRYGLMPPELMMTVSSPNSKSDKLPANSEVLLIGKKHTTDTTKFYGMRQSVPTVFTIETTLGNRLMANSTELRNHKVFEMNNEKVSKFVLKQGANVIFDAEKDKDQWKFIQPKAEFNPDAVKDFVEKLNEVNIETFIDQPGTEPALLFAQAEQFRGLVLTYKDDLGESTVRLGLGSSPKYVYLKHDGESRIAGADKAIYEYLKRGSINLRKRNLINIQPDRVKNLVIEESGKAKLVYVQEKLQEWSVMTASGVGKVGNPEAINGLRNEICYLAAADFAADHSDSLSPFGLDKPSAVITMEYEKDDKSAAQSVLKIGKKADNGNYYSMLDNEPVIFYLNAAVMDRIRSVAGAPPEQPQNPAPKQPDNK